MYNPTRLTIDQSQAGLAYEPGFSFGSGGGTPPGYCPYDCRRGRGKTTEIYASEEVERVPANRDERGRFVKGASGNPSGRPACVVGRLM